MQVYDLLRGLEFCRTLENVAGNKIGIAAREEMGHANAGHQKNMDQFDGM